MHFSRDCYRDSSTPSSSATACYCCCLLLLRLLLVLLLLLHLELTTIQAMMTTAIMNMRLSPPPPRPLLLIRCTSKWRCLLSFLQQCCPPYPETWRRNENQLQESHQRDIAGILNKSPQLCPRESCIFVVEKSKFIVHSKTTPKRKIRCILLLYTGDARIRHDKLLFMHGQ